MTIDLFLADVPTRRRSAALFDQLREGIAAGRLRPGDRLPTTRELAAELGVARSTVTTVYGRLVAEGHAEGRPGDGTYVAELPVPRTGVALRTSDAAGSADPGGHPLPHPVEPKAPVGGWRVDLRTGRPDPRLFPLADWRRSVSAATVAPPPGYGHPAGTPDLRRALAAWVNRSRGLSAHPDEVVVTTGAQGAFDLCARALCRPGDLVAVENPGYAPARRAFAAAGARIAPVPVDDDGMMVDRIPAEARLIVVTPSHQSPTGAILSAGRRRRLLELAAAREALVVEDDYDTEFRYVDRPLEPLHRLDVDGRVLYVGSFSKTLSPSLRLGFVVAPTPVADALVAERSRIDTQPPHLTQAALTDLLVGGAFERHLRRSRRAYRRRRDRLVAGLTGLAAAGLIQRPPTCPAGLHLIVHPGPAAGRDAAEVAGRSQTQGILVETSADSWIGEAPTAGLVIGFGLADEPAIDLAIGALAASLR